MSNKRYARTSPTRRVLEVVILVPLAALLVLLAVANRAPVTLSINPFDPAAAAYSLSVPLYWVIFAALALGVALGGIAVWLRQRRYRGAWRAQRREAERLRVEKQRLEAAVPALPKPPSAMSAEGGSGAAAPAIAARPATALAGPR